MALQLNLLHEEITEERQRKRDPVTLEAVAAAREPRAAAEDLRQLLIEQLDKNYSTAKVTFKNLEDLDTLVNLSGTPTASARFVLSITLDPKPADPAKANEPTKEI